MLRTCLIRMLLFLSPFFLINCSNHLSAAPLQSDPLLGAPADFSFELIVRPGPSVAPDASHLASAHYIIDPDGSLHYSTVSEPTPAIPPIVRKLSRRQLADLWATLKQTGFSSPSAGTPPINHSLIIPLANETVHLIAISADARDWEFLQSTRPDHPTDQATIDLINTLASLAWVNPNNSSEAVILPTRYDFGPDPYARYRKTTTLSAPAPSKPAPQPPPAPSATTRPATTSPVSTQTATAPASSPSTSPASEPDSNKP